MGLIMPAGKLARGRWRARLVKGAGDPLPSTQSTKNMSRFLAGAAYWNIMNLGCVGGILQLMYAHDQSRVFIPRA